MRSGRIIALIVGCLLLLLGGGGLGLGYAFGQDDAGYLKLTVPQLQSSTAAITAPSPTVTTDPGTPAWLTESLRTNIRLRVTSTGYQQPIFTGVGPTASVQAYLAGIGHEQVTTLTDGRPTFHTDSGSATATAPASQTF